MLLAVAQDQYTIIKDVDIYAGERYRSDVNVVYQEGRIVAIGKTAKVPAGAKVIDGRGSTIVPPLINAHVHIWTPDDLKESLQHGIFAQLDMHTTDELANRLRKLNDSLLYAYYYSSNAGATVPGGHGTQYGIAVPTISDTVSAAAFVQDRIDAHADYIKILKEPTMATLSAEHTSAVIAEAHQHNKKAVAHVSRCQDALELTQQGVDGFAHIWYDTAATAEQLALMQTAGGFIIPTLSVIQKAVQMGEKQEWTEAMAPFGDVLKEVNRAYQQGIPILCGTDAPNFQMNYTDQLFEEMLLLSEAGLSNEDIIKAATINVYRAFNLKEFGVLEEGGAASFLIVEGNPLNNISDIKNPKRVIKCGQEVNAP